MRHRHRKRRVSPASRSPNQGERHQILCGINAVHEALRLGIRRFETIWLAEGKANKRFKEVVDLAAARGTPIAVVPEPRLTELSGMSSHQGVVAFVEPFPLLTLEQLITQSEARRPRSPLAILDGVKDPGNLGAIIRSAAAFDIGGIIIPGRRAVGITATVAKAAAGGLEYVPIAEVTNIAQCVERLKQEGFWIIGTDEVAEISCQAYVYPSPLALVFGEEGQGISSLVKRRCDVLVKIPGCGRLHSLNVAVAAAVLFYEINGRATSGRSSASL